jgi:hypothetical protein
MFCHDSPGRQRLADFAPDQRAHPTSRTRFLEPSAQHQTSRHPAPISAQHAARYWRMWHPPSNARGKVAQAGARYCQGAAGLGSGAGRRTDDERRRRDDVAAGYDTSTVRMETQPGQRMLRNQLTFVHGTAALGATRAPLRGENLPCNRGDGEGRSEHLSSVPETPETRKARRLRCDRATPLVQVLCRPSAAVRPFLVTTLDSQIATQPAAGACADASR